MEKARRNAYHQALDAGFTETVTTGGSACSAPVAPVAPMPIYANADAYRERMKRREHSTCRECGAVSDMGDNYCRMCGKSVTPTCRSCGQALPKETK